MYEVRNVYLEHISKEDLIGSLELGVKMHKIDYYYCILHDKDKRENGDLKKEHFHLYIECEDIKGAKEYIKEHIYKETTFERVQTPKSAILYLVHKKDKDKYQYNVSEVFSNNMDYVVDTISNYKPTATKTINKISNDMLIEYIETKCFECRSMCAMIFESDIVQWCKDLDKRDFYLKNKNRLIEYLIDIGYVIQKGRRDTDAPTYDEEITRLKNELENLRERYEVLDNQNNRTQQEIKRLIKEKELKK